MTGACVILSAAKNLKQAKEILSAAKNDGAGFARQNSLEASPEEGTDCLGNLSWSFFVDPKMIELWKLPCFGLWKNLCEPLHG
jgi:hypothetical protein